MELEKNIHPGAGQRWQEQWSDESAFFEHHLTYTFISGLLIGASRSVLAYFLPSLTISLFISLTLYNLCI
jgi:hypothetical protein